MTWRRFPARRVGFAPGWNRPVLMRQPVWVEAYPCPVRLRGRYVSWRSIPLSLLLFSIFRYNTIHLFLDIDDIQSGRAASPHDKHACIRSISFGLSQLCLSNIGNAARPRTSQTYRTYPNYLTAQMSPLHSPEREHILIQSCVIQQLLPIGQMQIARFSVEHERQHGFQFRRGHIRALGSGREHRHAPKSHAP